MYVYHRYTFYDKLYSTVHAVLLQQYCCKSTVATVLGPVRLKVKVKVRLKVEGKGPSTVATVLGPVSFRLRRVTFRPSLAFALSSRYRIYDRHDRFDDDL